MAEVKGKATKVKLTHGYRWLDKKTGWQIVKGEVKECPSDDIIARANGRLKVLITTKKEEKNDK